MQEDQGFKGLGLSDESLAAVEALGWELPTPIQRKAIPHALEGKDIVGIAQTGTGKTGAFMLPTLERIRAGEGLQALILAPTRELAQQVCDDTKDLARGTSIRASSIYGGVAYGPQLEALREGHEVIAATPGRFIDHLEQGNANLSNVSILILDEADRMLDMGFRPQIEAVLRKMKKGDRQTMLFSATMPNGVHALALQITDDPIWVEATPAGTVAEGVSEVAYFVKPEKKPDLLLHLMDEPGWDQVLVFTRTKVGADALQVRLERSGIRTGVMHSDRNMAHRTKALDQFAEGKVRVLVATDIAQRGLDVEGISHVVNYDIPRDPEDYVHRIGRTGRAGAVGTAVTFITAGDLGYLKSLEYHLDRPLERVHLKEFDYAGSPSQRKEEQKKHSRSAGGFGTKSTDDLDDDDLAELLKYTT